MLRLFKTMLWAGLLVASATGALAFSLAGPINEPFQIPLLGYNLPGDNNAPKPLAEEYRHNTPVMYYTIDVTFLDYFGSNGVAAIDSAFALYNVVPPASQLSPELSEFPMATIAINYEAQALFLSDVKTVGMALIAENLGLSQPDRWTWCLHDRWLTDRTQCPWGENYFVVKRNFDPALGTSLQQLKPTSYVNGVLWSYYLVELCNAPLPPQAVCMPFPLDQTAIGYTAVATFSWGFGSFYTGLTRDDVGGLRYLLSTNNINTESTGPNTTMFTTNYTPQVLLSSNLTILAAQSLTNDPAALAALYPGLLVSPNSTNFLTNVFTTNVTAYFTNSPWDPMFTPPHLAFATNVTSTVMTNYSHTFFNAYLATNTPNGWRVLQMPQIPNQTGSVWVSVLTTNVGATNQPWSPVGVFSTVTNITMVTYLTNAIVGDFLILPTNICAIGAVYPQLTNVTLLTNTTVVSTNFSTTNSTIPQQFSQTFITYFTNHYFWTYPVTCQPTNVALYQGVDKLTFIRRDYDSLLSRFFVPITNEYDLIYLTNNTLFRRHIQRVVNRPDYTITASDMTTTPASSVHSVFSNGRSDPNWNTNYEYLAGPGTIETPCNINYSKVGPLYQNGYLASPYSANTNTFFQEADQRTLLIWGSFDGSTNEPVIYPNDLSIANLNNMILIEVSPPVLPDGTVGDYYSVQMQAINHGATNNFCPPYVGWGLAPGSPGLPPGLQVLPLGGTSGLVYGTPTTAGFYDFVIRITDINGNTADRSYAIRVVPAF